MAKTPLQTVQDQFGGREALVGQLADMVDKQHGDASDEEVKSRLMRLSNQKLLRLYKVEQKVRERFGGRDELVTHIIDRRKKAGLTADDAYRTKIETFTKAQLLDLTRENMPEPQQKLTAEERMKRKRGKKQRERAAAAAK